MPRPASGAPPAAEVLGTPAPPPGAAVWRTPTPQAHQLTAQRSSWPPSAPRSRTRGQQGETWSRSSGPAARQGEQGRKGGRERERQGETMTHGRGRTGGSAHDTGPETKGNRPLIPPESEIGQQRVRGGLRRGRPWWGDRTPPVPPAEWERKWKLADGQMAPRPMPPCQLQGPTPTRAHVPLTMTTRTTGPAKLQMRGSWIEIQQKSGFP